MVESGRSAPWRTLLLRGFDIANELSDLVARKISAATDPRERLIQCKTNIDVVMSVLERDGLGDWLANRLVEIGDSVPTEIPRRVDVAELRVPGQLAQFLVDVPEHGGERTNRCRPR